MVTLISKDKSIVEKLASALDKSEGPFLKRDYRAIASEYLAEDRAVEQIELFKSEVKRYSPDFDFKGKKLLEIGAGVGAFLITLRKKFQIDAYGIEPSEEEFSPFNEISNNLLTENGLSKDIIIKGRAEKLPFKDESFDLIYSTNVLEHVQNPEMVLKESLRVLKRGGYLQFVIPNYFSFWEGHYGVLWPCITNKTIGRFYIKMIGLKPAYIDTLQLISPAYLRKIFKKMPYKLEILGWGGNVFKHRLESGSYSDWASLKKIRWIVNLIQALKISSLIGTILNLFGMYTPIVVTVRKLQ